jgi:hypothetical protein
LLDIETPESEDENRRVKKVESRVRAHRDSDSGQHVVHKHIVLMAFLNPVTDQGFLGIFRGSLLLLGFGAFGLPLSDELLLLLLNLICEFALGVDIIVRKGLRWGSGSDGVTTFRSNLGRAKEAVIHYLGSRRLGGR